MRTLRILFAVLVVVVSIPQQVVAERGVADQNSPDNDGWTVWRLKSVVIHDMWGDWYPEIDPSKPHVDVEASTDGKAWVEATYVADEIDPSLEAIDLTQDNICRVEWSGPFSLRWMRGDPGDWGEYYVRVRCEGWDWWDYEHRGSQETWSFTKLYFRAGDNPPETGIMRTCVGWGDGRTWLPRLRYSPNPHLQKVLTVDTYHCTRCSNFPWDPGFRYRRCPADHARLFFRMPTELRVKPE